MLPSFGRNLASRELQMAVLRWAATLIVGAGLLTLTAATTKAPDAVRPLASAPGDMVLLPVATLAQDIGESIRVCMYHGASPRDYPVVHATCRGGGDKCTAFVAVTKEEADFLLLTYDLSNPPVEANGAVCDRPLFLSSGVLGQSR